MRPVPRERTIELSARELRGRRANGRTAFVLWGPLIQEQLLRDYGREGLCLKVWKRQLVGSLEEAYWGHGGSGGGLIVECAQIQNIAAMYDLAPRVYDVVRVQFNGEVHAGQVVEYASEKKPAKGAPLPTLDPLREKLTLNTWDGDFRRANWRGGRLIDFERERFASADIEQYDRYDKERQKCFDHGAEYEAGLVARALKGHKRAYQAVPELGIPGRRNLAHRVEAHRLGEVDFRGKSVLDLGCNLGVFSRYAWDRGAKRVVGVDVKQAELAYEVSNRLNYWNLDFLTLALPREAGRIAEETGIGRFDVVICFAMIRRAGGFAKGGGLKPWMDALVGDVLCLESHDTNDVEKSAAGWRRLLAGQFREVEFLGRVKDDRRRFGFRCKR